MFVVDSTDRQRIQEAREALNRLLENDVLAGKPLLVFCNKQDLPNAMQTPEVTDKLSLYLVRDREWFIQSSCALTNNGVWEGLTWLAKCFKEN